MLTIFALLALALILAGGLSVFTPVAGYSGSVTAGATALPTIEWTLTKRNRLCEITSSATSGAAKRLKGVSEESVSATFVWDSASSAQPESYTLDAGDVVTLVLKIGNSALAYTLTSAIIETLEISVNNQNGAVMAKITGFSQSATSDPA